MSAGTGGSYAVPTGRLQPHLRNFKEWDLGLWNVLAIAKVQMCWDNDIVNRPELEEYDARKEAAIKQLEKELKPTTDDQLLKSLGVRPAVRYKYPFSDQHMATAVGIVRFNMEPDIAMMFREADSALVIRHQLMQLANSDRASEVRAVRAALGDLRQGPKESGSEYVQRALRLYTRGKQCDVGVTMGFVIDRVLQGFRQPQYQFFCMDFSRWSAADQSDWLVLLSKVDLYDAQQEQYAGASQRALVAKEGPRRKKGTGPADGECFNCGEKGHWRKECPKPVKQRVLTQESTGSPAAAAPGGQMAFMGLHGRQWQPQQFQQPGQLVGQGLPELLRRSILRPWVGGMITYSDSMALRPDALGFSSHGADVSSWTQGRHHMLSATGACWKTSAPRVATAGSSPSRRTAAMQ